MEINELKPIIESMIFISEEPLTVNNIVSAFSDEDVERSIIKSCIEEIIHDWNNSTSRGLECIEVAGGYQFRTKSEMTVWLKRMHVPKPVKLSAPALETLAIISYKQPIVRSEVDKVRGVDSGGVIKTLLERRLLRIVGRRDEPGQPLLYGTTKEFLEVFNLKSLKELPTLRDIDDLIREKRGLASGYTQGELLPVSDDQSDDSELKRYSLNSNVEDEAKDMRSLSDLEDSLKDLRQVEKSVFPKPECADALVNQVAEIDAISHQLQLEKNEKLQNQAITDTESK